MRIPQAEETRCFGEPIFRNLSFQSHFRQPFCSMHDRRFCFISKEEYTYGYRSENTFIPRSVDLLVSAVVPRPIAFLTSMNVDDNVNADPYSFFNAISSSPPLVIISAGRKNGAMKHTAENILRVKEFCRQHRYRTTAPIDETLVGRFSAGNFRDRAKQPHACPE